MTTAQTESSNGPRILRGAFDSLSLYEITDYELEALEEGSPSSTFLNFGIAFISIGLSFLTTLLTVKIESVYVFLVFLVLAIVGLAAALVLFVLWRKTRSRVKDLIKKIKARAPVATAATSAVTQGG